MCVWVLHLGSVGLDGLEEKLHFTDGAADECCALTFASFFLKKHDLITLCKGREEKKKQQKKPGCPTMSKI